MQHKDYGKFERIEQYINDYHEESGATLPLSIKI